MASIIFNYSLIMTWKSFTTLNQEVLRHHSWLLQSPKCWSRSGRSCWWPAPKCPIQHSSTRLSLSLRMAISQKSAKLASWLCGLEQHFGSAHRYPLVNWTMVKMIPQNFVVDISTFLFSKLVYKWKHLFYCQTPWHPTT